MLDSVLSVYTHTHTHTHTFPNGNFYFFNFIFILFYIVLFPSGTLLVPLVPVCTSMSIFFFVMLLAIDDHLLALDLLIKVYKIIIF
jgi:hypothetical protein